ncbi:hypothetical protein BDM02DRAFT_3092823 [Thelephora ganbajun]|uniref:Uncharacterized protein n=1 Tax=Thelephora ganbajun TaxID=370292 RepID=A0ACB6ZMJ4_THEGA|nr:hypothetical protein BDM02DRAFT_3092823 [Thelephora ganbajun]
MRCFNLCLPFDAGDLAIVTGKYYFLLQSHTVERKPELLEALSNASVPGLDVDVIKFRLQVRSVIHLDESPDDTADFLLALHYGIICGYDASDFCRISAILRLATKYSEHWLRDHVIAGLSHTWPATLAQWDERERRVNPTNPGVVPFNLPHPIQVAKLAREVDVPRLLLSALYDLSRNTPSRIASGMQSNLDPSVHHTLSQEDLFRTLRGREIASRFLSTFIVKELEGRRPSHACTRPQNCRMAFECVMFDLLRDVNGLLCNRNSDVLFAIAECAGMLATEGTRADGRFLVCCWCHAELCDVVQRARAEVWASLPTWFNVEVDEWGTI